MRHDYWSSPTFGAIGQELSVRVADQIAPKRPFASGQHAIVLTHSFRRSALFASSS
jgi:hypothetical protein